MSAPLPPDVRDLLAAVLDAIDLPYPRTAGDVPRRREVLAERAMHAAITLRQVLRAEQTPHPADLAPHPADLAPHPADLARETSWLRERLAANPPSGYAHWPTTPPGGGGS
jgi:hypothetical protein